LREQQDRRWVASDLREQAQSGEARGRIVGHARTAIRPATVVAGHAAGG
jgi:hypothetical protein